MMVRGMVFCVAMVALTGCVSRTVTVKPVDQSPIQRQYGSKSDPKLVEKKIIWIWQDEYRNP